MDPISLSKEIQERKVERAKFVRDNSLDLAPFGTRSANLKIRDAQLFMQLLDEGTKMTVDQREAELTIRRAEDDIYQDDTNRNKDKMMQLAILDATIEALERAFTAMTLPTNAYEFTEEDMKEVYEWNEKH
jgi:hypothetical protein